ncbi:MAG TPA: hypothetical protein VF665_17490 [Longimicrobium sp.]|jgi:hypothetical protein|uniref:hypothetical protein n=1 Tax=Longimicrobium sp. TaxID=2029185 RepID=UPI002ED97352
MPENEREQREYSLKEREYRGEDGQIHHHTNAYMQRQAEEGGRERSGESRAGRESGGQESGGRESGGRGSRGGGQSASGSRGGEEGGSGRQSQSRGGGRSEANESRGGRSRGESESRGSRSRGENESSGRSRGRSGGEGEEEGSARDTGYTALVTAVAVGVTAITAAALMSMFRSRNEEVVVYDLPRNQNAAGYNRDDRAADDRDSRY